MRSLTTAAAVWTGLAALTAAQSLANSQSAFTGPEQTCLQHQFISLGEGASMRLATFLLDVLVGVNITQLPYGRGQDFTTAVGPSASNLIGYLTSFAQECPYSDFILSGDGLGASAISAALAGTDLGGNLVLPLPSYVGEKVNAVVLYGDATQNPSIGTQGACDAVCTTGTSLTRIGAYADALGIYADRLQNWCTASDNSCCGTGTAPVPSSTYASFTYSNAAAWFVLQKYGRTSFNGLPQDTSILPTCSAPAPVATSASPVAVLPAPEPSTVENPPSTPETQAPPAAETSPVEAAAPSPSSEEVPPADAAPSDYAPVVYASPSADSAPEVYVPPPADTAAASPAPPADTAPPAYISQAATAPGATAPPPAYVPPPATESPAATAASPAYVPPPADTSAPAAPPQSPPPAAAPSSATPTRPYYHTITNARSVAGYPTTVSSAGRVSSASSVSRLPLWPTTTKAAPSSTTSTGAGSELKAPSSVLMGLGVGVVGWVAALLI